ncbi:MAG TPA: hypothetical protein PKW95_23905 [bacterium]|nr:hypothetical protein [bacterium]
MEASVDCCDDSATITGFLCVLQDNIKIPFAIVVFGSTVIVERIDFNESRDIVAVCRWGEDRQNISIPDLLFSTLKPRGAKWVDICRCWTQGDF